MILGHAQKVMAGQGEKLCKGDDTEITERPARDVSEGSRGHAYWMGVIDLHAKGGQGGTLYYIPSVSLDFSSQIQIQNSTMKANSGAERPLLVLVWLLSSRSETNVFEMGVIGWVFDLWWDLI